MSGLAPGVPCIPGWPPKTGETTNALHMSVIPKGPKRGWIIVWGEPLKWVQPGVFPTQRQHQYAIFDPEDPTPGSFTNFCYQLPAGLGDLFCAGHAWTSRGNLLVAGGTDLWEHAHGQFSGSTLVYLWEPPTSTNPNDGGTWHRQNPGDQDLDDPRWYPSVVALGPDPNDPNGGDSMMILGGIRDYGPSPARAVDSYQVWRQPPPGGTLGSWQSNPGTGNNTFPGPGSGGGASGMVLQNYPRAHLLSSPSLQSDQLARVAFAGWERQSDRLSHYDSAGWLGAVSPTWQMFAYREYGSSVLLPIVAGTDENVDRILALGGLTDGDPKEILDSVEVCSANGSSPGWSTEDPLLQARWMQNAVLMPSGRVFVVGGEWAGPSGEGYTGAEGFCVKTPSMTPEIYDGSIPAGGASRWRALADQSRIHDYHSSAVLVASGKIVVAGGEFRKYTATGVCGTYGSAGSENDYEVYQPDYLKKPGAVRPVILEPGTWQHPEVPFLFRYGQTQDVSFSDLPEGVSIDKVALLRTGSVTHHSDGNQRCVFLSFIQLQGSDTVRVFVPGKNVGILPRGFYMLFLLSKQGDIYIPSVASFVKVED